MICSLAVASRCEAAKRATSTKSYPVAAPRAVPVTNTALALADRVRVPYHGRVYSALPTDESACQTTRECKPLCRASEGALHWRPIGSGFQPEPLLHRKT